MKIIRMHRYGGPEVLTLEEADTPDPGEGQILVRVEAASVNWSDTMRRRDDVYPFPSSLPFTPGGEVAGTVEALGAGVDGPPVGTPVFALAGEDGSSGYAQFAVADATRVIPIPPGVSSEVAATMLVAGLTASLMLGQTARIQPGESVLVPGAAGGVGTYAVQIAKLLGAGTVIGLASTPARRDAALARGADHALDPADPHWSDQVRELTSGRGVDIALEATGGAVLDQSIACLAPFGRCIVYGYASRTMATLGASATETLLYRPALNQSLIGFNIGAFFGLAPEVAGPAVGQLLGWLAAGEIHVPIARTFGLADAQQAHQALESHEVEGKIVLNPWPTEATS